MYTNPWTIQIFSFVRNSPGTALGQRGARAHGGLGHWVAAGYADQLLGAPAAAGLAERGHVGPRGSVASGLSLGEVGRRRHRTSSWWAAADGGSSCRSTSGLGRGSDGRSATVASMESWTHISCWSIDNVACLDQFFMGCKVVNFCWARFQGSPGPTWTIH